ncbi:MAG: hypothetical protein L0I76_30470 [Pseudonocardia sp.]|nr:hypothetical protein [Pseudonocardia sp.]
MKTARVVIVAVLLPLAIAGALVLSASATIDLATSWRVPVQIAPAAVAMLEIVSLAGTLLWVLVGSRSLRRDAVVATLAASLVSLVAGVHAYGLFGPVAPLALVGVVHLASRAWREDWAAEPVVADEDADSPADEPVPAPDVDEAEPGTVLALVREREQESPLIDRARELVAAGVGRGRLARELQINEHEARKLLAEVKQA